MPKWGFVGFEERFEAWIARESVPDDVGILVWRWLMDRRENPHEGVSRVEGFENLWFAPIPDTHDGAGRVATCSYWIEVDPEPLARCNDFAMLSPPFWES